MYKRYHLDDYSVYPSVVKSGQINRITIYPRGDNAAFVDGACYRVSVSPMETLCAFYNELPVTRYDVIAQDGVLSFSHRFDGEQTHVLSLELPPELQRSPHPLMPHRMKHAALLNPVLYVYSLEPDLYARRVYKGDLHLHTWASDGHDSAGSLVGTLRRAGYDFLAVTDHFGMTSSQRAVKQFAAFPPVVTVMTGEEIHLPEERIHVVGIGARQGLMEYYLENKETCDAEVAQLAEELNIPEDLHRLDFAYRVWIARKIREFGGLSILTHPHWNWLHVFFMADPITIHLLRRGDYDALEVLHGSEKDANNQTVALYQELRAEGRRIPIVASSDMHEKNIKYPTQPADTYTLVFAPERDSDSLCAAIRDLYSVAVEHYEGEDSYHIHGPYRLVKYAAFLLHNYYPVYMDLCQVQGRLIEELAWPSGALSGEAAALLERFKQETDRFSDRFFGNRMNQEDIIGHPETGGRKSS